MTRTLDRFIEEFLRQLIIVEVEPHIQVVTSLMGEGEAYATLPRIVIECQSQDTPEFKEVGVHRIVTQITSMAEATSPVSSDDLEEMNTAVDRVIVFADNLPAYLSSQDVVTHGVNYGGESQQTLGNKLIRVRSAEIWARLLNANPIASQVPVIPIVPEVENIVTVSPPVVGVSNINFDGGTADIFKANWITTSPNVTIQIFSKGPSGGFFLATENISAAMQIAEGEIDLFIDQTFAIVFQSVVYLVTAQGLSLLDDATAAAQRTTLELNTPTGWANTDKLVTTSAPSGPSVDVRFDAGDASNVSFTPQTTDSIANLLFSSKGAGGIYLFTGASGYTFWMQEGAGFNFKVGATNYAVTQQGLSLLDDVTAIAQHATLQLLAGTSIAAASTTDLGAATGRVVSITGNGGPITALGTTSAGAIRKCIFTGTPTLTHNATSLILPGNANVVVAAGDCAEFISLGSGNWYCSNYQRQASFSSGGGGGDLVSPLTSSEISITGATTATISRMHVCSGTSADYTVTLPAVSGNAGKLIGFRMAGGLTKIVTLDGASTELIDGALTRPMWAGESAILLCDGSAWFKIAGRAIPMSGAILRNSNQSITTATVVKINVNALISAGPASVANVASSRLEVQRTAKYDVTGSTYQTVIAAIMQTRVHVNGAFSFLSVGNLNQIVARSIVSLTAGDTVELYAYNDGVSPIVGGAAGDPATSISITEIISW